MGSRAFDPALFALVDQCRLEDTEPLDDFSLVEQCPTCGEHDLVFNMEEGQLVDLDGKAHKCPEV